MMVFSGNSVYSDPMVCHSTDGAGGSLSDVPVDARGNDPVSESPTPSHHASALSDNDRQSLKVLVVDDDESVLLVTGQLLEALGHDTCYARSVEEAEQAVIESLTVDAPFQVAVIDLLFSGDPLGETVNKSLKSLCPELLTIACSGQTCNPVIERPKEFNFDGSLKKPYTLKDIDNVLAFD